MAFSVRMILDLCSHISQSISQDPLRHRPSNSLFPSNRSQSFTVTGWKEESEISTMVLQTIMALCLFLLYIVSFLPVVHSQLCFSLAGSRFLLILCFPCISRTVCSPFGIVMPVHIIHHLTKNLSTPGTNEIPMYNLLHLNSNWRSAEEVTFIHCN